MKSMQETTQQLERFIELFSNAIKTLASFKADPSMLKGILVDHYGVLTELAHIATISSPSATTLHIDPWDKKLLSKIEAGIAKANNPDLLPVNTGEVIKISLPPMTGERRLQIIKKIDKEAENTKVKIRQERKKENKKLEELKNEGTSEDIIKKSKEELQKLINKYISKVEELQGQIIKQINQL